MRGLHQIGARRRLVQTEHDDFDLRIVLLEVLQRLDLAEYVAAKKGGSGENKTPLNRRGTAAIPLLCLSLLRESVHTPPSGGLFSMCI